MLIKMKVYLFCKTPIRWMIEKHDCNTFCVDTPLCKAGENKVNKTGSPPLQTIKQSQQQMMIQTNGTNVVIWKGREMSFARAGRVPFWLLI